MDTQQTPKLTRMYVLITLLFFVVWQAAISIEAVLTVPPFLALFQDFGGACPGTSFLTTLGDTIFYDPALVGCMKFSPT
jgi:ABC-type nitrate/sulfonate/bicarbonate transport system permease component